MNNSAKQKFEENIAKQAMEANIPSQYVFAACRFHQENGTPFKNLYYLFSQWVTYVVSKNKAIDVNQLDFNTFWNTIQEYKKQYEQIGQIYNDGIVSIRKVSSFDDMKKLPFANSWYMRKQKEWDECTSKTPPAQFYLIVNNNYTDESNCRYVMIEMYSNGEIGYWSTDNELIDEEGSSVRLPKLSEYQKTLGGALQKIQELQKERQ